MARSCPYCGDEGCLVHCVYCLTDCSVDEPEHGPACPSVTGCYPIPHPGGADHEPGSCIRCDSPFTDAYYLVQVDGSANPLGLEDAAVYEVVCFDCKVAAEIAA